MTGDPEPAKGGGAAGTTAVQGVKKDPILCSSLMQFICELVEGSTSIQQQVSYTRFFHNNIITVLRLGDCWPRFPGDLPPALQVLPRSPHSRPPQHLPQTHQVNPLHISAAEPFATRYLVTCPTNNSDLLLKQLLDHCLFNPSLWIHTPAKVYYTPTSL